MILGQVLLLCVALALNYKQRSILILTLCVGAGVLVPIPAFEIPSLWYLSCILVEGVVLVSALHFNNNLSFPIAICAIILIFTHLCGMIAQTGFFGGSYKYTVLCLEYTEILSCILFSDILMNKFRRQYA